MDIEKLINRTSLSVRGGAFSPLFINPIYVAILITICIMMIVLCIFDNGTLTKTTFYIFCTTTFFVFLHNKLLLMEYADKKSSEDAMSITGAMEMNNSDPRTRVMPDLAIPTTEESPLVASVDLGKYAPPSRDVLVDDLQYLKLV